MLVDSRSIGTDLIDLGERRQPFGAFSFHACPVLPQGELHLVRDMPQTALKKDVALPFEPIEDGGASIPAILNLPSSPAGLPSGRGDGSP